MGDALLRSHAKTLLDDSRRQIDHLLKTVEESGTVARVAGAIQPLAANEMAGIALGEKDEIAIKRTA